MRKYRQELAAEYQGYTQRQRYSMLGVYVIKRIAEVSREVSAMEQARALEAYEQVKIEIKYDEVELRKASAKAYKARTEGHYGWDHFAKEEAKRRLFAAMVEGFAKSREIDLHLYFREVSKELRTIGIRLYFKNGE